MPGPEVVLDDADPSIGSTPPGGEKRRDRRSYRLLAIVVLLLLLLCGIITSIDIWTTRGPAQASFISRNLECLQCHTELIPDFSKASVHQPFIKKECTTCHTPHGKRVSSVVSGGGSKRLEQLRTLLQWLPLKWWFSLWKGFTGTAAANTTVTSSGGRIVSTTTTDLAGGKSSLVLPEEKLCWTCHGNMGPLLKDPYQHQPFSSGRCVNCHDPHASDFRGLLKQAPNKLCFTCHPIGQQLNRMQSHPPARDGWCTDCHNPHASNYKGILVTNQRTLCFRCHPSVAGQANMPVQHQPFISDNCTGCHQPHGSDTRPLLNKPQPELCYTCHPKIADQFAQKSHHPISVSLTCGSCHDPHAAQYRGLINARDNSFCYQCHDDKQALYSKSAHLDTLCISCHTPHGSPDAPMLVESNPDLCLRCHPAFEGQNKHPVRPKFLDVHAGQGLTCTSSCHNPHGTTYNYMLKNFSFPQDGMCLQCHKYVGILY